MLSQACFPASELDDLKRPKTAGTQFKESLNALIDILVTKQPSYVRCIKPNSKKQVLSFDRELVSHQVKYLALMENLRVRRAGFAYRRPYVDFLERYKSLAKETWPSWKGTPKEGVGKICNALNLQPDDFRLGHTKVFLKEPKTVFLIEELYVVKHTLITHYSIAPL